MAATETHAFQLPNAPASIIYDASDGRLQATFSLYLSNFILPFITGPFIQSLAEKGPPTQFYSPYRSQSNDELSQEWNELYQALSSARSGGFCFSLWLHTPTGCRGVTRGGLIFCARGETEPALTG